MVSIRYFSEIPQHTVSEVDRNKLQYNDYQVHYPTQHERFDVL